MWSTCGLYKLECVLHVVMVLRTSFGMLVERSERSIYLCLISAKGAGESYIGLDQTERRWFGKIDSLSKWQVLVSMSNFWGVSPIK